MVYSSQAIKFWRVMYRLFHGKALRFMGGLRCPDEDSRGGYNPLDSSINFAVPSQRRILTTDSIGIQLPKEIPPGIIKQALEMKSDETQKTFVLSCDGKKLAPGLNDEWGDQDLFGHESQDSLSDLKAQFCRDTDYVEETKMSWNVLSDDKKIECLQHVLKIVSSRIKDLRVLYMKQQLALKKFLKEGGPDWKNSKYVYAISSVQAQIFQIKNVVMQLLDLNRNLVDLGTSVNNTKQVCSNSELIDISSQPNLYTLKEVEDLPDSLSQNLRFVKQRSSKWFEVRKNFKLTGSSLYSGLGLETLKLQQRHYDKVVRKVETSEEISEDAMKRMEHGTLSEIHAISTLTSRIMPLYFPNMVYVEEGAQTITIDGSPCIIVSPDGCLCQIPNDGSLIPQPAIACEFKCPSPADYKTPVHYELPLRYIPQVLGEMACLQVDSLIYLCWTKESSTVFRIFFDEELWEKILEESKRIYFQPEVKRPTRLTTESKQIKKDLSRFQETHCQFLCEVPSVEGENRGFTYTYEESPYLYPIVNTDEVSNIAVEEDVDSLFNGVVRSMKDAYQVCRKKATEVLVWILSDTDRIHNPETPYALPVAYGMKGYSLGTDTMRRMHEDVLRACHEKNINVACSCFDGQWARLTTRDKNENPLTLIQLQRDVYTETAKMSRETLVKTLSSDLVFVAKGIVEKMETRISVSCPLLHCKMQSIKSGLKNKKARKIESKAIDTSCLPEEALETLIDEEDTPNFLSIDEPVTSEEILETTESEAHCIETVEAVSGQIEDKKILEIDKSLIESLYRNLQCHPKATITAKWKNKTIGEFKLLFNDPLSILKLQHDEMNLILEETKERQKLLGLKWKKSCTKDEKARTISKIMTGKDILAEKTVKEMLSLKEFAMKVVRSSTSKIPKERLNNATAAVLFGDKKAKWQEKLNVTDEAEIEGVGKTQWFSYPEFDGHRQKLEPKCLDAHHLLVNLRCKVCKDGLKGIRKEAWHTVAESKSNVISKGIVVDLLDKQNNAFAKRTFSLAVENEMRNLHFVAEADFCKLIRHWYEAEDSAGLSAVERIRRKLELKDYLLKNVEFDIFPPPGMYIKGFPKIMFEGFLQRIDTSVQLYSIISSYNHRSISSLVNETFFGELSDLEPTKLGCPKAVVIPRLMSNVTEMQHFRCDPSERYITGYIERRLVTAKFLFLKEADRAFHICTARRPVYPTQKLMEEVDVEDQKTVEGGNRMTRITLRNHKFDDPVRLNKAQRKSKQSDISKPHEVSRGCLPIRQHHKCDESKILPTTRLGISLDIKENN